MLLPWLLLQRRLLQWLPLWQRAQALLINLQLRVQLGLLQLGLLEFQLQQLRQSLGPQVMLQLRHLLLLLVMPLVWNLCLLVPLQLRQLLLATPLWTLCLLVPLQLRLLLLAMPILWLLRERRLLQLLWRFRLGVLRWLLARLLLLRLSCSLSPVEASSA